MLLLRDAAKSDLEGLLRLAKVLDSVNLPFNRAVLKERLARSADSFAHKISARFEREYLFVLEDVEKESLLGTSLIIPKHGTKDAPNTFFEVSTSENYSRTLDKHFHHRVLSIGYNYDGPTEIGGLVVHPSARGGASKPGKQISYVRFLFMAMFRENFRDKVIAELMPPLLPDGRSLLWEAIGKKFTGLEYKVADALSRKNKEFIKELFPPSDIYVTLFDESVQKAIGEVGPETKGVKKMLERIGFRHFGRIDPFDGGPMYEAYLDEVSLVRAYRAVKVAPEPLHGEFSDYLVGISKPKGPNRFRAVLTQAHVKDRIVHLSAEAREALNASSGDVVGVIPFE